MALIEWVRLKYSRPTEGEPKEILGEAKFYSHHTLDASIVEVLRHPRYDVQTAGDIGAEVQPDTLH